MDNGKTLSVYRVEDFGAKGDGKLDSTESLQAAIDHCSSNGGGRVIVSEGTYLSGTLELKSNVDLCLNEGSVLKGIRELDRYPEIPNMLIRDGCSENPNEEKKGYALLYSFRAREIGLSGTGIVDVGGEQFQGESVRPFLLRVIESEGVSITGLSFRQSAAWCCHVQQSRDITIKDVTIWSSGIRHGDGLDIDSSTDVSISGCNIRTNDDAICFKTTTASPCRNIRVTDCVLESDCSGVKLGTESVGDFSDIHVSRCTLRNCGVVALKVTPVDGGSVENITFSDLKIEDSTGPIFIATGSRGRRYTDQACPKRRSHIRNVSFRNIDITTKRYERSDGGTVMNDRGQGIVVSGRPGQIIRDVRFKDLRTAFWGNITRYDRDPAKVPVIDDQYPECHKLGILPSYGYFFQHAENVMVERCTERLINHDVRPIRWDGTGTK